MTNAQIAKATETKELKMATLEELEKQFVNAPDAAIRAKCEQAMANIRNKPLEWWAEKTFVDSRTMLTDEFRAL